MFVVLKILNNNLYLWHFTIMAYALVVLQMPDVMFFNRRKRFLKTMILNHHSSCRQSCYKQHSSNIPFSSCVFLVLVSGSLDFRKISTTGFFKPFFGEPIPFI